MSANLLTRLRRMGVNLRAEGGRLLAEPKSAVTDEARSLILANREELLSVLSPIAPDLEALIVRAGAFWEYSPEDFDLIRAVARRDPEGLRLALQNDPAFQSKRRTAA